MYKIFDCPENKCKYTKSCNQCNDARKYICKCVYIYIRTNKFVKAKKKKKKSSPAKRYELLQKIRYNKNIAIYIPIVNS